GDGLPVGAAGLFTGPAFAGFFDVVVGYRTLLRLLDSVVERRVARGVTATDPGGNLDVLDQPGEHLAASGIDDGLLVLGGGPLGMAAHPLLPLLLLQSLFCCSKVAKRVYVDGRRRLSFARVA